MNVDDYWREMRSAMEQRDRCRAALEGVMTLVDTDPVWRASGFAKSAREVLAEPATPPTLDIDTIAAEVCLFRDPEEHDHPDRATCAFSREIVRLVLCTAGVRAE